MSVCELSDLAGVDVEDHDGAADRGAGQVVHEEVRDLALPERHQELLPIRATRLVLAQLSSTIGYKG